MGTKNAMAHEPYDAEAALDRLIARYSNHPERIARMRTEVPNGHNLSVRDLILAHTVRIRRDEEIGGIQNQSHGLAGNTIPGVL